MVAPHAEHALHDEVGALALRDFMLERGSFSTASTTRRFFRTAMKMVGWTTGTKTTEKYYARVRPDKALNEVREALAKVK